MGCAARSLQAVQVVKVDCHHDATLNGSRRSIKSFGQTINKSCDACSAKKRRCNGGRPCRRCLRQGSGHSCTYSVRQPYTSSRRCSRVWRSSPDEMVDQATSTTRVRPCRVSSTRTQRVGPEQRDIRSRPSISPTPGPAGCKQNTSRRVDSPRNPKSTEQKRAAETPHQLSAQDVPPKSSPIATEWSSPAVDDVRAGLARAHREAFALIVSSSRHLVEVKNGLQCPLKRTVASVGDSELEKVVGHLETAMTVSLENYSYPRRSGLDIERKDVVSSGPSGKGNMAITPHIDLNIIQDDPPIFSEMIIGDPHIYHTSSGGDLAGVFTSRTETRFMLEDEDPISAEDWLEIAAALNNVPMAVKSVKEGLETDGESNTDMVHQGHWVDRASMCGEYISHPPLTFRGR